MAELDRQRGDRIRDLREAQSWTQRKLAEKLGVDVKSVRNWERGKGLNPENFEALAEVFNRTPDFIRFGEREAPDLGDLLNAPPGQQQLDRIEADVAAIRVEFATLSTQLAELQKLLRRRTDTAASKTRSRKAK